MSRCHFVDSGEKCQKPRAYELWAQECACCYQNGFVMCVGHPACVEHAAMIRAEKYRWTADLGEGDVYAAVVTS
jgi:hypothetical protein